MSEGVLDLDRLGRVHMVGIGGQGMAPIAEMLHSMGVALTGSDAKDSARVQRLARAGIPVRVGHDPAAVEGVDTVMISRAVRESDPELAAARAAGIPVWVRSDVLAALAAPRRLAAVAGTHGKTTTSAMLAVLLERAGADPSYLVGGEIVGIETGARLGGGPLMVAEADESDASFLKYSPEIAIVLSLEPDHLDHYGSTEAFEAVFDDFVARVTPGGLVIACADDPATARLAERVRASGRRVVTFAADAPADVRVTSLRTPGELRQRVILGWSSGGELVCDLRVAGAHNALDAAAALLAAIEFGIEPEAAARALEGFAGAHRRFDLQGVVDGVEVYDDFGHHPTEIAAMLTMAREYVGEGRVHVLFQPYLFSRTRIFAREFAAALALADDVVVCDILGAREDPEPGVTSQLVVDQAPPGVPFRFVPDRFEAARAIARDARPGDVIVTTGCGNMIEVAPTILDALAHP